MVRVSPYFIIVLALLSSGPAAAQSPLPGQRTPLQAAVEPCLEANIGGWHLLAVSCSGTTAEQVRVTPPGLVQVSPTIILPSLPLRAPNIPVLPIVLPPVQLTAQHFALQASGLTLDQPGLSIAQAGLMLPSRLASAQGAVSATNVIVDQFGSIVGGRVTTTRPLTLKWFDVQLRVGALSFNSGRLTGQDVSATLPTPFHAPAHLRVKGLQMDGRGQLEGTIPWARFRLGDLGVQAESIEFSPRGLAIYHLQVHFPYLLQPLDLNTLEYDAPSKTISIKEGKTAITLPPISLGAASVEAAVAIRFSVHRNVIAYDLDGKGKVTLPHLGTFAAEVEIGSVDAAHPVHLYHATVSVTPSPPIPIGSTPLRLVKITGDVQSSHSRPVTYTFELTGGLATVDRGFLFNGSVTGSIATDGNVGLAGKGQLFHLIDGRAGVCFRFVLRTDSACKAALGKHVAYATGTGAFFALSGHLAVRLAAQASAQLDVYGHLWFDHGVDLAAHATVLVDLPRGFIVAGIPPCAFKAHGTGLVGRFHRHAARVAGLKVRLTGQLDCFPWFRPRFSRDLFIDQYGHVEFGDSSYVLDEQTSQKVTPGHAAAGQLARPATVPAPSGAVLPVPDRSGSFSIPSGQIDTTFTLFWRSDQPVLTLEQPDGEVIQPGERDLGIHTFYVTNRRLLPKGFTHGLTILAPTPFPGRWQVRIGGLTTATVFRFIVNGAQSLSPLTPLSTTLPQVVASPGQYIVPLAGALDARVRSRTVALYYVPASVTFGPSGPAAPGTLLAARVPLTGGTWHYRWDARAVPAGRYTVYAVANNGLQPIFAGVAAARVLVEQPIIPPAPRFVTAAVEPHQFLVQWLPPQRTALIAGYYIRWRTADQPAGQWLTITVGKRQSFALNRALPRAHYSIAVASFDVRGFSSVPVAATLR